MEPVRKHWRQGRFEQKRGNAETFNLFNAFRVSKVFNELHCLYYPSLPILSFSAEGRTMSFASLFELKRNKLCLNRMCMEKMNDDNLVMRTKTVKRRSDLHNEANHNESFDLE